MSATTHFLPKRDGDLLAWSTNFNTKLVATPTAYGLTAPQATAYTTLHTAYATAYASANSDDTRTPAVIVGKNLARHALVTSIRSLAKIIQGCPTVTDIQRTALGLNVKSAPMPIPVPAEAPVLLVVSATGHNVHVRLQDASSPTSRAKPPGVAGASVFSFVGAAPPVEVADWKFEGNTTQRNVSVSFHPTLAPGSIVWLTAFWYNRRAQSGPGCTPVSALIAGGQMQQAA